SSAAFINRFILYVLFFFSSRRRHTRSLRDWSSDVCSSDLGDLRAGTDLASRRHLRRRRRGIDVGRHHTRPAFVAQGSAIVPASRSEERRVGKESTSRSSTAKEKN